MAVDFAADLQQELDYFAGPQGMGVDGFYIDCTRTSSEWLLARCGTDMCTCRIKSTLLTQMHLRLVGTEAIPCCQVYQCALFIVSAVVPFAKQPGRMDIAFSVEA